MNSRQIIESIGMGNKLAQEKPVDDFSKMVQEIRKDQSRKVSVHPEKKYLNVMIEQVEQMKFSAKLKELVLETLNKKITSQELINTVSVINSLKNNQFDSSSFKSYAVSNEKPESKYVFINFGTASKFVKKMLNIEQESPERLRAHTKEPQLKIDENAVKEKLKTIAVILKKQINRIHHPFWKLNKIFAEYVNIFLQQSFPHNPNPQAYEKIIVKCIGQWCSYLQLSCLWPYKKWIINYTSVPEPKYKKWVTALVMQEIWSVNNGYLYHMIAIIISARKVPLKIEIGQIQYSSAIVTPSLFQIDKKLQIEGHFFDSIYQMSEIESICRPESILAQLQTVKKRICTDIDNYHRLQMKGERFQIDSDNIIGIVAYILCKISNKIDEIYTHLIFLRIIYGDNVYYSMGVSSYMLSTIFGAIQYLESEDFRQLLLNGAKEQKEIKQKGSLQLARNTYNETNCTSHKGQNALQAVERQKIKLVSSLVQMPKEAE